MATQRETAERTLGSSSRVAPKKINAPDRGLTMENNAPNASKNVAKPDPSVGCRSAAKPAILPDRCAGLSVRLPKTPRTRQVAEVRRCEPLRVQQAIEDLGNFEDGAILDARDPRAQFREAGDDFIDARANVLEGIQHDAGAGLRHPLGVVALLRHGPGVVDHDDRQSLLNGFADTAGAGFADEEIAELHEVADLRGKADHEPG